MPNQIYLDYNASTPVAPEVIEAMRPFWTAHHGNPSSGHWAGRPAKEAVEHARVLAAGLIGAAADEVVFTSGGSESNNHAIKGVFFANSKRGDHVITSAIEHPAVLIPCRFLESLGATLTVLPVDRLGRVDPDDVRRAMTPRTILVTIMHANNEVGTIQPIAEIARIAREHGALFHTDAAQSAGKIPVNVEVLGVDLLSIAGHKVYATKGVGALYVRRGTRIEPLMHGAGHESGRRAGTENVILNVGLGAACRLARDRNDPAAVQRLRDRFWRGLQEAFGDRISLNGHPTARLPNTLNVNFVGRVGAEILDGMPEIAASTGSACHAGSVELSPVLSAMKVDPSHGMGAVRFSLGRETTAEEIDATVCMLRDRLG
ncbi:MAG: cysteine desulfurase family protein [Phycisphaerae bacterium]